MKRFQRWLGGRAMISVPGLVVFLVGVRHDIGFDKKHRPCPIVHRDWWEWFDCSQASTSEWIHDMQEKMLETIQDPLERDETRLRWKSITDSSAAEARILAASLHD